MSLFSRFIPTDYVRQAQRDLNDAGYNAGSVDGKFGPKTLAAVRRAIVGRR